MRYAKNASKPAMLGDGHLHRYQRGSRESRTPVLRNVDAEPLLATCRLDLWRST